MTVALTGVGSCPKRLDTYSCMFLRWCTMSPGLCLKQNDQDFLNICSFALNI